jgi:hypothetical protein
MVSPFPYLIIMAHSAWDQQCVLCHQLPFWESAILVVPASQTPMGAESLWNFPDRWYFPCVDNTWLEDLGIYYVTTQGEAYGSLCLASPRLYPRYLALFLILLCTL